jgi:uncharacterized lipoprotein
MTTIAQDSNFSSPDCNGKGRFAERLDIATPKPLSYRRPFSE